MDDLINQKLLKLWDAAFRVFCNSIAIVIGPTPPGTGLIAGGGVRAVLEMAGVKDVLTKQMGSPNSHNVVKATVQALMNLSDAKMTAARRGVTIQELFQ